MREHILAQFRDNSLRRAREQVHLDEVHCALERESEHESDRDAVEQCAIVLLERRVEQLAYDLRKGEAHGRGDEQAHRANHQSSRVRTQARQKRAEWLRRFWRQRGALPSPRSQRRTA